MVKRTIGKQKSSYCTKLMFGSKFTNMELIIPYKKSCHFDKGNIIQFLFDNLTLVNRYINMNISRVFKN